MKNIYVGNISYQTTESGLSKLFGSYGTVGVVKIVKDNRSGKSKGFAFVEMESGADEAVQALNGQEYDGRTLRVAEAHGKGESSASEGRGDYSQGPRRSRGNSFSPPHQ